MRIYVDLRCLQEECGAAACAALARGLLGEARPCLGPAADLIGLLDEALPPLPADLADLVDCRYSREPLPGRTALVQPSPLAPDPAWPAPLLASARVLSWAVVDDSLLPGEEVDRHTLGNLVWLERYDLFAATTESVARRLRTFLRLGPDRVTVTGGEARLLWAEVRRRSRARPPGHVPRGSRKPRLAVLSPYPPDRSGVADYTACCVRSLARRAAVDVFTAAPDPRPDPWVRHFAPVSDEPYILDGYDGVLAVVGNSEFHTRIIDLHCRYGGACLVHDNRLAEIYAWVRGAERFAEMASRSLGRPVGIEESQSWLREPALLPSLFFDEIVTKAEPLLVHSRGIQARVQRQYRRAAIRLPFCCYRSFRPAELSPAARRAARARLGLPPDRIVVATFGILGATKAPLECLAALQGLRARGVPAELHFAGPLPEYMKPTLLPAVERLGLRDAVRFPEGWVPEETYRDYLIAADLGVQLRTYGFGQLSGALADCISAGLPTVANADLADSVDAPSYVLRVPNELDPVGVAERLRELVETGRYRARLCPERAAYCAGHNFDTYADELLRALKVG
jgi:glycosyltransferase involved in cell wall biosynthesis